MTLSSSGSPYLTDWFSSGVTISTTFRGFFSRSSTVRDDVLLRITHVVLLHTFILNCSVASRSSRGRSINFQYHYTVARPHAKWCFEMFR